MRQDWDKRKIGEICEVLNGFAFKSSEYVENGIRVIRITNVQKGFVVDVDPKYYPMTAKESIKSYLLNSGDLLMSLTGNVGRVGVLQKEMLPAALNQRVACLRIKDKRVLLKYLFHNLNSPIFEQDCINSASGVAQKNMSTEWLKKYLIGIPPIAEQEKIIAELDCLTGIIEKKKQQLEELDKLAQSIFYEMFGDPITNEKGWEVKKLGDVCEIINGFAFKSQLFKESGDTILRISNIQQGYVDLSDAAYFNKADYPKVKFDKYVVLPEDIVIALSGATTGKLGINRTGQRLYLNQRVAICRETDCSISHLYLLYFLKTQSASFLDDAAGVAQPNLSTEQMKTYQVCIPSPAVQHLFAKKIEAIEKQKELIKKSIQETETLFNSRMDYWFN